MSYASWKFILVYTPTPDVKKVMISAVPNVSDPEIFNGSLVAELSTPIEYVAVPAFTEILASPVLACTT